MSRQVPPNGADRFDVELWLDDPSSPELYFNEARSGSSRFFHLAVSVRAKPAATGGAGALVVLAIPFPAEELFWTGIFYSNPFDDTMFERGLACVARNKAMLDAALRLPGERSRELVMFGKNPTRFSASAPGHDPTPLRAR